MARKQYYGIKYPFTYDNLDLVYLDLNETYEASIQSQVLHIIFTPKGQRLRDPGFGTDLIKYLFDSETSITFENLKTQIRQDISSRIPNVEFKDIQIIDIEGDEHSKIVSVDYVVKKGNVETLNNVAVKI